MKTSQLEIAVETEPLAGSNYAEALAIYEADKKKLDLAPVHFCQMKSTGKYSCTRLIKPSLLESFNFKIIH